MASNDPLNPAGMHRVYISEARCNTHLLRTSGKYRLHFTIEPPSTVTGLRSPKSEYIKATCEAVTWKDPFGDEFSMVSPTPIDCRVTIDLCERRFGRKGQIVASCALDLSSATGNEIRLDLQGAANDKVGELTICVTSSLASASDAVGSANSAVQQLGPGLTVVNDAMQATTLLATEVTAQVNAWQPLLSRLSALVKVADAVAEVHPWIKLAWGVVSAAYKIPSAQSDRDAKVMGLVQTMADSCSFADEAEGLKGRSKPDQVIINQILRQVMECTYFIRDYCRDKSFAHRTVKYTVSLVDARIDSYKGTLESLRRNLIDHANIQCTVVTHRVLDVVTEVRDLQVLSELKYAPEARHDLDQECLPGTRTEIIETIVRWAVGADTPSVDGSDSIRLSSNDSSRVLWLCGVAGAGKSSILRSCAKRISELERMGSYYGFDRNQPLANLTSLFSTIAQDLADLDKSRKQRLVDAVKDDTAIRRTLDCKLQFQHFIKKSFEDDQALGETIVFLDAFDESRDDRARANVLAILTTRASELPPDLRIVVTSRHEPDIQDALQSPLPPGVDIIRVDDIPLSQTSRDIAAYIRHELRDVKEFHGEKYQKQLAALIGMAETSFQWAATACGFICSRYAGADPGRQIGKVLDADKGLYGLYSAVMKQQCNPSDEIAVNQVKSILGRIICTQEPLSLLVLVHLVPPDSILTPDDVEIQRRIVKHLGSLLSGTHSDHEPIVALHSSYRDFLCNPEDNKDFCIDQDEANQDMALACFRIMDQILTFNICQLPTSFLRNVDIPDITGLCKKHISDHLSYACRFWAFHVSATSMGKVAQKDMVSFFKKDFLPWLEVMSLTQSSPQSALALLSTSHMSVDLVELQHDAKQFISMFATAISTSAPHIYLSGLTFAPTSSLLYKRWKGQFPRVAKLTQGQLQDWPNIVLILEGHHGAVRSVAFSPDGKQIASGSADMTIRLWNAETGVSIGQPMKGHGRGIRCIAFSPDGEQIASGSWDRTIQLWNVETGVSIGQPMKGHKNTITSIAFSPDGKQIASGSDDKTIKLWNVETGASIGQPMKGHDGAILSLAFSPDGKQIASGSDDKTIQLWNVGIGARIGQPMKGHDSDILSLAFSSDGKHIASGSEDRILQLWSVETGENIRQPMGMHARYSTATALSPDGKQIASASSDWTIQLWNVETGASIGQPMMGHKNFITSIAFSPDGQKIASGSYDATVQLWNVGMNVGIGEPIRGHHDNIESVAFSPDGKWVASGAKDGTIQLWNMETGASIGQPMKGQDGDGAISSIAFSPDGKKIVSSSSARAIQLWNVETGASIGWPMKGHGGHIRSIGFSPDGEQIASGSQDGIIQLWNVEPGASIGRQMKGHDNVIYAIAFSPDGKKIASGSGDKTIQLWNAETGVSIGQPMKGHHAGVKSIAFSPDGKKIASGSWDMTIQLWNVETGASIWQPMKGHAPVWSIAFSPDGKQIASSSSDKTIQLWNVETGASIGQPSPGHGNGIWSITFFHDGNCIASSYTLLNAKISWLLPAQPKHSPSYPTHLFPLPSSPFQVEDGWILGPSDELILWVPAAYHASLEHPHHHAIGNPNTTRIDFQPLKCGREWAECQEVEK